MQRLLGAIDSLPGFERMRLAPIDRPMLFRDVVGEATFEASAFNRDWVAPRALHDACNVPIIQRSGLTAMMTAWSARARAPMSPADVALLADVSPHLRRAILIGEEFERTRRLGAVGTALLDRLPAAVVLVGAQGRMSWANAPAEALLASGRYLAAPGGRLRAASSAADRPLAEALSRAAMAEDAAMGPWGCALILPASGIPPGGAPAFAYVLPFGRSDVRHGLDASGGDGIAAVVVVAPGSAAPPPVELVSAFLGLSAAEARVALTIAEGVETIEAARRLNISTHTLRKHLANIFARTGLRDRVALVAAVAQLRLPLLPQGPAGVHHAGDAGGRAGG